MLNFLTEDPARILRKRDCKCDHDDQGLEIIKYTFSLFLRFVILTYLSHNKHELHGGFDAMGGATKEVISRSLRFSAGRMFPLTYSGSFSMTEFKKN